MSNEPFNGLTDAQAERLAILIEECGEVVQAATKVLRHGYLSENPVYPDRGNNRDMLERELGDVMCSVALLNKAKDIRGTNVRRAEIRKGRVHADKLYTHHQP